MATRIQLFVAAGIVRLIEPLTDLVYKEAEKNIWINDLDSSPHGEAWNTSFHASSFPGDDQLACGRKAVYSLLNIPNPKPTSRFLRGVADAGKAIETEIVRRFYNAGLLLSAPPDAETQTGFKDEEYWLTGNCDAIVLPYKWNRPHVIEIKSKADDKIQLMKALQRKWDDKHRNQILTYIGFTHETHPWKEATVCRDTWKLATSDDVLCRVHGNRDCLITIPLAPCKSGTIFYVSRDNPSNTWEFTFSYDPIFMDKGRSKIMEWQEAFQREILPDRPRFDDGKLSGWSKQPCQYCDLKPLCKKDWTDKVESLRDSHAIKFTKELRSDYDYDKTREAVIDRWAEKTPGMTQD